MFPDCVHVVQAREVAAAGSLDLDDAGAEVGQLASAKRRRDSVLEGDDGHAFEWAHAGFLAVSERAGARQRRGRRAVLDEIKGHEPQDLAMLSAGLAEIRRLLVL